MGQLNDFETNNNYGVENPIVVQCTAPPSWMTVSDSSG